MPGLPRTTLLLASLALGALLMAVFATGLVQVVRRAVSERPAADPAPATAATRRRVRTRLFLLILGVVIGSWFFTFGLLSLVLGV